MINKILHFLDRKGFRGMLRKIIFVAYKVKGNDVQSVRYNHDLNLWEAKIGVHTFLCPGPGWAYTMRYLEENLIKYSAQYYKPKVGDIVIDLGSGIGEETLVFSTLVGERGKVYSIEASPRSYRALIYLCQQNNLTNVISQNLALAESEGHIFIEDQERSYIRNTVSPIPIDGQKYLKVPSISFDQFVDRHKIERIDFLKVNIEGAEQILIKGMNESIRKIKNLAISCHDFRYESGESEFYKTREVILNFLTINNFTIRMQSTGNSVIDSYVYGSTTNL